MIVHREQNMYIVKLFAIGLLLLSFLHAFIPDCQNIGHWKIHTCMYARPGIFIYSRVCIKIEEISMRALYTASRF